MTTPDLPIPAAGPATPAGRVPDSGQFRGIADVATGTDTRTGRGSLFEITRDSGELVWLAFLDDATQRFHVYDHHTGCFHHNHWLTLDYEIDSHLGFTLITPARARGIVTHDRRHITLTVLADHLADTAAIPVAQVLGLG